MAKKLCIVDDSITAREIVRAQFKDSGYEILEAEDGLEAKEMLSITEVDLLITDFEMPRMNGLDLARSVRQMLGKNYLPIIILSSIQDIDVKKKSTDFRVVGWLDKAKDIPRLKKLVYILIGAA